MVDKDGKIINEPSPIFNHSMDAIRYGMESLRPSQPIDWNTLPKYQPKDSVIGI
jgi:hypothetical protein